MKLKALLLTTLLSTTLFAGFTTVDCNNPTHLDTLQITQGDCFALESFWDATGQGAGWINKDGWDDPTVSAKDWYGITLWDTAPYGVKWLSPRDNNITGILPDGLSDFTTIQTIGVANNNFSGNFPKGLQDIESLVAINISENNYSGELPIYSLLPVNLEALYAWDNYFIGHVPTEYVNLTQLKKLLIDENLLSGSLPDLSQLSRLIDFRIDENKFTFSDIEPQIVYIKNLSGSVIYFNQEDINESTHPTVYFEDTLTIEPSLSLNPSGNDYYIWKKDSTIIEEYSGARIYTKENATLADVGCYGYDVNNSQVTFSNTNRNLILHSNTCINVEHDNTPTVTNQTPSETVIEDETYTYTSMISDEDSADTLSVTSAALPTWLTLSSHTDAFTLEGTPTLSDLGSYDINITVTDGKIPVHINYKLRVDPESGTLPAGFTLSHGIYTHTATGKSINSDTFVTFENAGVAVTGTCLNNKKPYTSIDSSGKLTTGYTDCLGNNPTETFSDPLPNNTKASIVTNNAEKMILIEIPLTQDITLQGN